MKIASQAPFGRYCSQSCQNKCDKCESDLLTGTVGDVPVLRIMKNNSHGRIRRTSVYKKRACIIE